MTTKNFGLLAFFIGMVLAVATVFWDMGEWVTQVLIILGILAGFFHTFKENLVLLGVVYLALATAASSMSELIAIGPMITDLVTAFVGFLGPVVLTAMMIWGGAKLVADKTEE